MSGMDRLQRLSRDEARRHFSNGYEMAGYYAAHCLDELQRFGVAPIQVGILGQDDLEIKGAFDDMTVANLDRLLAIEHAGASAIAIVRELRPRSRRDHMLLASVRDICDGYTADIMLAYSIARGQQLVGQAVVADITGMPLTERELAKLGCLLDFNTGLALYTSQLQTVI